MLLVAWTVFFLGNMSVDKRKVCLPCFFRHNFSNVKILELAEVSYHNGGEERP